MSRVFVAEETALGRKVVIKVLPPETAAQVSLERFKREILLAAKLQHPHIVPLLSAGESEGLPYFTMPLVEGESLRVRLARHGELPVNDAIRILREIAAALTYAHEHGIVHRDIKPDNVLLSGGSAMVTDFGVAKALSASSNAGHGGVTSLGVALGTPAYMAPEQATADPAIDHRADIYAFGVLAYELLTGQPPFAGRTPQNLLAAHVTEAPEGISKRRASLPPALAALVMRCLEKRPADRPQRASEIVHALDDITTPSGGMQPTGVRAATSPGALVPAASSIGRRRSLLIVGATVVIASALGWWAMHRGGASSGAAAAPSSIAVLPFSSSDTAGEYFAVGISDAVRSDLTTRVHGMRVMSRSSSMSFRGQNVDARSAGTKLGVSAVLGGEVRTSGTRLHITAELVNVADGSALWSGTFDRESKDVFALQDSISHAIAGSLQSKLADEHRPGEAGVGTTNLQAYDLYLRGRFLYDRRGETALRKAAGLFQQAIALDPKFARAYAGLGGVLSILPDWSDMPADSAITPALAAVDRAIELDPTLAEAFAARGSVLFASYRWKESEIALRRAIELDPQYGMAYKWLGELLFYTGRIAEAAAAGRRATELDPTLAITWVTYAWTLFATGADSAARAALARSLELDATMGAALENLAQLDAIRGKTEQAVAEILKVPDAGMSANDLGIRAYVLAKAGHAGDAEKIVHIIENGSGGTGVKLYALGEAYLGLGDLDRAMDDLIRASRTHDVIVDPGPYWDPLKSHPRYAELMRALNLQDMPIAKMTGSKQ
ncbi:MAG: protein kinase, partial [Gemmatimonadales bacterium]